MSSERSSPMGVFERYLSLWVSLCIVVGVGLGAVIPDLFRVVASFEYASVNLVVAVFIWVMIYPMMAGGELVDQTLHHGGPGYFIF